MLCPQPACPGYSSRVYSGLLEAHPDNPLGRLIVEDDGPCRVDDQHRHEEVARQLANEDHLYGLRRCFRGHHQPRPPRSTSAGKSLSSTIRRMGGMFRRRYGGAKKSVAFEFLPKASVHAPRA